MIEHWTCEEEGNVSVDMKLGEQLLDRRQPRSVIILSSRLEICDVVMLLQNIT